MLQRNRTAGGTALTIAITTMAGTMETGIMDTGITITIGIANEGWVGSPLRVSREV